MGLALGAPLDCVPAVYYIDAAWAAYASFLIFVLAAATDWLDGYLARKARGAQSNRFSSQQENKAAAELQRLPAPPRRR